MDLKVLRLFKQHFLDNYDKPLICDYSCWGYYDGLSLNPVSLHNSSILCPGRFEASISDLWYSATALAEKLEGFFSEQDIGIFRKDDSRVKEFENKRRSLPYFVVGFLQIANSADKIHQVIECIEKVSVLNENLKSEQDIITYYTFDNADLIVLMCGNSIMNLEESICRIEEMDEVAYFHVIMGISEKYLEYCNKLKRVTELWNSTECHINDPIKKITVNLVAKRKKDFEEIVKKIWKMDTDNVSSYYVTGHENLIIEIDNTSVGVLIELLMKGGFSTHQNRLYKTGAYNITTGIRTKKTEWDSISEKNTEREESRKFYWCLNKMSEYKNRMWDAFNKGDESLYSYYNSFLLTLNTLNQFENFSLSRNVYYMVFPAFRLFDSLLSKALLLSEKDRSGEMLEKIKNSICNFLDSVNSIIYHTIHTDQMFLMIPGYTGTSFLIPIRLCLFYLWFIKKVIAILNDSRQKYEYQCLLAPERESKATTELISMGLPHGNRLICVKLSQRSLYMPRELLLILAHEIAHYVGDDIRNRKERAHCIICTVSAVLANNILYGSALNKEEEDLVERLTNFESDLQELIRSKLENGLMERIPDQEYYADAVRAHMESELDLILADREAQIYKIINEFPDMSFESGEKYYAKKICACFQLQQKFLGNKNYILASGAARKLVYELSHLYKEIFSDVAAYMILDFAPNIFQDAFKISEGNTLSRRAANPHETMRIDIIKYLCDQRENAEDLFGIYEREQMKRCKRKVNGTCDIYTRIAEQFYYYDVTKSFILMYVNLCKQSIEKLFERDGKKTERDEVKKLFELFCDSRRGADRTNKDRCFEIIQEKIDEYVKTISEIQ